MFSTPAVVNEEANIQWSRRGRFLNAGDSLHRCPLFVHGVLHVVTFYRSLGECFLLLPRGERSRCAACFARFPHMAMLHQRRIRPPVVSTNSKVQVCHSHAL